MANFIQMYPAYKLLDVMNEHAIVFFTLLNEGYRIKNAEYLTLANIALLPHVEAKGRDRWLKQLQWASIHPSDILNKSDDQTDSDQVKKFLKGM